MSYETHTLTQGDEAWHAHRTNTYNASDAGTALGINPYKSRGDLIRELATGITKEIDAGTQRRFDDGHRFERLARSIAEQIIGEDLSPTTVSIAVPGLSRRLSASLDGATFGTGENWEHKTLSASLLSALDRGEIPEQYHAQMEQAMMINGAHHCLFMASKFDDSDQLTEERHLWYESNPELRAKIIAAWKQIEADVTEYSHIEPAAQTVAERPAELPALDIQIVGNVVASNLAQWRDVVKDRIAAINTNLTTDQEFSDAKAMVKFLDDGEKRIELVKSQVLAQAVDINAVLSAMDEIKETMRAKRLGLDKTVKAREESIKIEIMQAGKDALAAHIAGLNKRLAKVQMPPLSADFAAAIKGKRNLESMRGAVADLVAAKKIESNEIADRIQINLIALAAVEAHAFMFNDFAQLVLKSPDDLALVIKSRIQDHVVAEERRIAAETARIRAEEEAKATAKAKAEQEEAERQRKAAEEAAAKIERDRLTEANQTRYEEPAAQPAANAVTQAIPPAPVVVAAPIHLTTGTARIRDLIDDALIDCNADELSRVFNAIQVIKEERKAAA